MFAKDSSSARKSPEEFIAQLKELVAANVAGSAEVVSRLTALLQQLVKAGGSRSPEPSLNAATLLSGWLEFNLASYSILSSHSLAIMNGLLSAAEDALVARTAPASPGRSAAEQRVELRLEGRTGDRLTSAFLVENHFDRAFDFRFECGDLVPSTGAVLPASLVTFDPPTLSIGARAQAVVQTVVVITPEFVVGQTYTTVIRLLGLYVKEVGLSVTVRPPAQTAEPSAGPPPQTKPADKRRARLPR